jgi:hypothetical protein
MTRTPYCRQQTRQDARGMMDVPTNMTPAAIPKQAATGSATKKTKQWIGGHNNSTNQRRRFVQLDVRVIEWNPVF